MLALHRRSARQQSMAAPLPATARLAIVLEIFLGVGALFGGGALILAPDGHLLGMPSKLLAGSPFPSFLVPGIILFTFIGIGPLVAAAITFRRRAIAPLATVAVGLTLMGWVSVEMVVLAGLGSLAWAFYLVLGASIAAIGVSWWRSFPAPARSATRPARSVTTSADGRFGIDFYWLPLGAGGNFVRLNGRVYEAIKAGFDRRPVRDLYHSALEVFVPEGRYVIEMTPVVDGRGSERGVVAEGPVGARWAGRFRIFRYELRRWLDGVIPDINEAVESPRRLSNDLDDARRLLETTPQIPMLVWGRDELGAGEMWNSNSMISWLIARAGLDASAIKPPAGGRAPGWNAGVVAATRGSAPSSQRSSAQPLLGG